MSNLHDRHWHSPASTQQLRILHLGKYYAPAKGGIETHVRALAHVQTKLDADAHVLCVNHEASDSKVLNAIFGSKLSPKRHHMDQHVRLTRLGRYGSLARFDLCPGVRRQIQQICRQGVDIVHLHTPNPLMMLTLATMKFNAPLVVTHHSDVVKQKLMKNALQPIQRIVYGRADRLLATSPVYAAGSTELRQFADKVEPLPLAVDAQRFLEPSDNAIRFARHLREQHGGPIWLSVGRLVYYKALHVAIDALPHVPGKLIVVGDGPLAEKLRSYAHQRGVNDRIVWTGWIDEDKLVGAMHAAKALWFPSNVRSEAFGLVQVEAMACGCPVINVRIEHSGVPWVSPDGVSGMTISPNNPAQLVDASLRLVNEEGLRARLALAARDRVIECFDHSQMAQRSIDIYRRVLSRKLSYKSTPSIAQPVEHAA